MSKYWTVSTQQWVKGLLVTVIGALCATLLSALSSGGAIDWKTVGVAALSAGLSYIIHALGTDSGSGSPTMGKFLGKV